MKRPPASSFGRHKNGVFSSTRVDHPSAASRAGKEASKEASKESDDPSGDQDSRPSIPGARVFQSPSSPRRVECHECTVGVISGVNQGQFCPFIVRTYHEGAVLYHHGQLADYVWFIKSGSVSLDRGNGEPEAKHPNSFIGTEAVETGSYRATARALSAVTLCGATRDGFAQWMTSNAEPLCATLCRAFEDKS